MMPRKTHSFRMEGEPLLRFNEAGAMMPRKTADLVQVAQTPPPLQ